ncbi:MAG: 50S ribosomal protein L29 [Nanoarchaeota archaeon]|nr:50S ribosomal protein L29 [Nanoarchaeota archaeon]
MKLKEIRTLDKSTLNEKKVELKKELVKMNAQVAIGTALKNPGQVREIKKTMARILTIEQERGKKADQKQGVVKTKQSGVDEKT